MRALLYLLLAIPFWYGTLLAANTTLSFLTQGKVASGVITDRVLERGCSSRRGKGCSIELTVAFETADGQRLHQRFSSHHVYLRQYRAGDQLPIRYQPSEPTQAIIANWRTLWGSLLFYGSAAFSFSLLFIRRLIPAAEKSSQAIRDSRLLLLIPVHLFAVLAIFFLLAA